MNPLRRSGGPRRRVAALGGTAAASSAAFALLAVATARRDAAGMDRSVGRQLAKTVGRKGKRVAGPAGKVGKWWAYVPIAMVISGVLIAAPPPRRLPLGRKSAAGSRRAGAAAVTGASVLALVMSRAFDRILPQPPTPPGRKKRGQPVFPSGHALGASAVSLAGAYALTRESLVPASIAWSSALAFPVAATSERILHRKHWPSDVLGGYLAGVAAAALSMAAYEASRSS